MSDPIDEFLGIDGQPFKARRLFDGVWAGEEMPEEEVEQLRADMERIRNTAPTEDR